MTDLLFVPAMASVSLFFVRIIKRDHKILIGPLLLLVQTVLISFYFEWYLPNFDQNSHWYTSDMKDVIYYFIGAILYFGLQHIAFKSKTKRA
ncbi:MAG: hypothetical protein P8M19_02240 [Crocinitomicaceae bacterium]|nr:hypothetical protein [Crocinitomicaceae bacterium]MDG2440466.1 hypothetical protein [Crocinitomicaceae bacterium]